ncbi:MAG: L,D-transpeptidase [Actinobacteria bacterium]|nr:L,D-transpeptidase [Actinomycetota bacterium]
MIIAIFLSGFGYALTVAQARPVAASPTIVLADASPLPTSTVSPSPDPSPSPTPEPPALPPPAEVAPAAPTSPALPPSSGSGRRVVYSVTNQRVWLVDAGEVVVGSWLVSGRRGMPRPGTYSVFSKSRFSGGLGGRVGMQYMTRFARGRHLAIGFHSIPVGRRGPIQTEAELGQFRSHGCVRQRLQDAATLWDFAPVGTKVVVTP